MMRSLFSGVSGLKNQQLKMDVIGNNIANVNTIGFKASRINFSEELSQLLRGAHESALGVSQNAVQIGLGVRTGSIDRDFGQGILQSTGITTDLGIDGEGLFVAHDGSKELFTRDGNFHFDSVGRMVTSSGAFVQGWTADQTGEISVTAPLDNIIFDASVISPAKATENVAIAGNLDAAASPVKQIWTAGKPLTLAADGTAAIGTTELNDLTETTTALVDGDTIIVGGTDADGNAISATFTYGVGNDGTTVDDLLDVINTAFGGTATAEIDADGQIVVEDAEFGKSETTITLAAGTANTGVIDLPGFAQTSVGFSPQVTASIQVFDSLGSTHTLDITFTKTENPLEWTFDVLLEGDEIVKEGSTGTLTFNSDGSMEKIIYDNGESLFTFDPNNGAEDVVLNLDFENTTEFSGITQYDGTSSVNMPFQDGQANGTLTAFSIDETGRIIGSFSNGRTRLIAQLALAKIKNMEGLVHVGNNMFEISGSSGLPVVGKAGQEIAGTLISGTLEASNVDLAAEFSEMIIAQRAFQANARVITVSDQFLNEVTQLKR